MGPIFSLALLSILAAIAIAVAFAIARLIFPARSAIVISLSFVLGATCGAFAVILTERLLFNQEALTSVTQVWSYFVCLVAASVIAGVVFTRFAYIQIVRRRLLNAKASS
jgi:uncharacterized membrane protein